MAKKNQKAVDPAENVNNATEPTETVAEDSELNEDGLVPGSRATPEQLFKHGKKQAAAILKARTQKA